MDNEERKEMQRLCTLIQSEQNPAKFFALLEQLNVLLEQKEKRLIKKLRRLSMTPRHRTGEQVVALGQRKNQEHSFTPLGFLE